MGKVTSLPAQGKPMLLRRYHTRGLCIQLW